MATRNPFLVNWVKTAYSMEMGLVPVLEKQSAQGQGDPELRKAIDQHLQATRRHAQMLRDRLQTLGETPSAIQATSPFAAAYGQSGGGGLDGNQQIELIDYVTEAYEWASYRALKALATRLGDSETGRVCDEILQDEMAMSATLDRRLRGDAKAEAAAGTQGQGVAGEDYAARARASFDALNAHDLDRWARDLAPDFRGEAPGMPGEMNAEQNRAYLQARMTAFPDLRFAVERIMAAGEQVVAYWVGSGRHTGPMETPNGRTIPPTNKPVRIKGITTFEFRQGKIRRADAVFDLGDLMSQLGLLPGTAMNAAGQPNRDIVHVELPARDQKAAAEFYHKMFGWDHETAGEGMNYTTFKAGNLGGGFPQVDDVYEPGGAILYVGSQDVDADLRRATELGARVVVPRTEIPGMGWYAIFADPTGNRCGLFSS